MRTVRNIALGGAVALAAMLMQVSTRATLASQNYLNSVKENITSLSKETIVCSDKQYDELDFSSVQACIDSIKSTCNLVDCSTFIKNAVYSLSKKERVDSYSSEKGNITIYLVDNTIDSIRFTDLSQDEEKRLKVLCTLQSLSLSVIANGFILNVSG